MTSGAELSQRGSNADEPATAGLRVVLAEDDVLLREGLASLFKRSGIAVAGQAGDSPQLLALVRETVPDLVVADMRMPPTNTPKDPRLPR